MRARFPCTQFQNYAAGPNEPEIAARLDLNWDFREGAGQKWREGPQRYANRGCYKKKVSGVHAASGLDPYFSPGNPHGAHILLCVHACMQPSCGEDAVTTASSLCAPDSKGAVRTAHSKGAVRTDPFMHVCV